MRRSDFRRHGPNRKAPPIPQSVAPVLVPALRQSLASVAAELAELAVHPGEIPPERVCAVSERLHELGDTLSGQTRAVDKLTRRDVLNALTHINKAARHVQTAAERLPAETPPNDGVSA